MKGDVVWRADRLTVAYGNRVVVREASVDLRAGEFVLLLGGNGAGKTSLLRAAAGLTTPRSGSAGPVTGTTSAPGGPAVGSAAQPVVGFAARPLVGFAARPLVGFAGHQSFLYRDLTVRENIRFHASLAGLPAGEADRCLEAWGLEDHAARPAGALSRGSAARASLCRAFVAGPSVLLLDEPTGNLDDAGVGLLLARLADAPRTAVLAASHDLARLGGRADRCVLLEDGRLVGGEGDVLFARYRGEASYRPGSR